MIISKLSKLLKRQSFHFLTLFFFFESCDWHRADWLWINAKLANHQAIEDLIEWWTLEHSISTGSADNGWLLYCGS